MLFRSVSITICAAFYGKEKDEFNVIEGMVGEVKMDWDGFVCVHRNVLSDCVQFVRRTVREGSCLCLNIVCG